MPPTFEIDISVLSGFLLGSVSNILVQQVQNYISPGQASQTRRVHIIIHSTCWLEHAFILYRTDSLCGKD